jgi:hypothetical protein
MDGRPGGAVVSCRGSRRRRPPPIRAAGVGIGSGVAIADPLEARALVALLDSAPAADPLSGFVDAWTLMAVSGGVVAVLALGLGRVGVAAAAPAEAVAR